MNILFLWWIVDPLMSCSDDLAEWEKMAVIKITVKKVEKGGWNMALLWIQGVLLYW